MTTSSNRRDPLDLRTARESESLTLTPRDWDAFFASMDSAAKPRSALAAAARAYLTWRSQRGLPVSVPVSPP